MENSKAFPEGISVSTHTIRISGACCTLENAQKIHESSVSSFEVSKCDSMFGGCLLRAGSMVAGRSGCQEQLRRRQKQLRRRSGAAQEQLRSSLGVVVGGSLCGG